MTSWYSVEKISDVHILIGSEIHIFFSKFLFSLASFLLPNFCIGCVQIFVAGWFIEIVPTLRIVRYFKIANSLTPNSFYFAA